MDEDRLAIDDEMEAAIAMAVHGFGAVELDGAYSAIELMHGQQVVIAFQDQLAFIDRLFAAAHRPP